MHPVELLQALIRFDTSGGRERRCIEYIGSVLGQAGVEVRYLALDPERPNLVARIAGRGEAPPLLLYGHVDVVPAEPDGWTRPPFAGDIVDGEVWGRGALDMKGGVAMLVAPFLHARKEQPPGDLVLALTVDEETGSRLGMRFLVEHHAELFGRVRFAISEFGGFTQWHGNKRFMPIQVAEKQRCLIRATVRGTGGHAASVVRGTASEKLGRLLGILASRRLPTHSTPVVRSMVEAMSAALPVHERLALRALLAPKLTGRLLGLIGAAVRPLEPLLRNTATPTMVHGGTATNVIPTELTLDLDGRVLPGHTPADLLAELRHLAGGLATFELIEEEPAVPADPDLTLLPLLSDVAREHDPGCVPIPMLLPGYTDARYVSKLGIQTYGFLPMPLPRHLTAGLIHATDERIPAAAVEHGVLCLAEVVRRYR